MSMGSTLLKREPTIGKWWEFSRFFPRRHSAGGRKKRVVLDLLVFRVGAFPQPAPAHTILGQFLRQEVYRQDPALEVTRRSLTKGEGAAASFTSTFEILWLPTFR